MTHHRALPTIAGMEKIQGGVTNLSVTTTRLYRQPAAELKTAWHAPIGDFRRQADHVPDNSVLTLLTLSGTLRCPHR
jgi:hypothetical protein